MVSDNNKTSSKGLGFCSALTIAFIVLKLTHYIEWPWVWVLAPAWIPIGLIILVLVIVVIAGIISSK